MVIQAENIMTSLPNMLKLPNILLGLTAIFGLICCTPSNDEHITRQPVAIENYDECHLCGMIILNYPGPKGQLYEHGSTEIRKFCSNRDMFAYLLDPEHQHNIQQVFVHNTSKISPDSSNNDAFIDARQAWFVVGSQYKGAMGHALLSFADEKDAESFAKQYGGQSYRFDQISLDIMRPQHNPLKDAIIW